MNVMILVIYRSTLSEQSRNFIAEYTVQFSVSTAGAPNEVLTFSKTELLCSKGLCKLYIRIILKVYQWIVLHGSSSAAAVCLHEMRASASF